MTSRRSIRSHQQRASRAFQFVPGHVGGRVASAQPVRRLGNISAQVDPEEVVVQPEILEVGVSKGEDDGEVFLLSEYNPPAGEAHIVFCCSTDLGTITLPSEWTEIDRGTVGVMEWIAVWNVSDGSVDDRMVATGIATNTVFAFKASWRYENTAGYVPSYSSSQVASGTSLQFQQNTTGLVAPGNVLALTDIDQEFQTPYFSGFDYDQNNSVTANEQAGHGRAAIVVGALSGTGIPMVATNTITATSTAASFWSGCFGWVPA